MKTPQKNPQHTRIEFSLPQYGYGDLGTSQLAHLFEVLHGRCRKLAADYAREWACVCGDGLFIKPTVKERCVGYTVYCLIDEATPPSSPDPAVEP